MTKKTSSMIDPMNLSPSAKEDDLLQVVVETPRGCRNKFAFDPEQKIFALKKVLPAGMSFPYDFGFLLRTKADDGDAIDVLLLMDEQ
jgi:inorganic pyrophosphatase